MSGMDASVVRALGLIREGKAAQAEPLLRRRVSGAGGDAEAARLLALVLMQTGRVAQAEYFARRAAERGGVAALDTLGTVLAMGGKASEAAEVFGRAVEASPGVASLWNGLGGALLNAQRFDGAAAAFGRARGLAPGEAAYWRHEAAALTRALRQDEARRLMEEGLGAFPGDVELLGQYAVLLNYVEEDPEKIAGAHRTLGEALERGVAVRGGFANTRDADRALRVGLVSADLRDHPVATFLRPLLEGGHGWRLAAYSAGTTKDETTGWVRERVEVWREVSGLDDAGLAARMRADGIDVAIDLGGHTVGSRVRALAHGAAPVQMTYLGYPATTGMTRIGWRIVDGTTDPAGAGAGATERLARIDPCFVCWKPGNVPEVAVRAKGPVTFGSFNSPAKLGRATYELWAGVLARVGGARLLVKGQGLEDGVLRARVTAGCAAAGIDPSRVECVGRAGGSDEHLAAYGRVDVALDTYPYHGTTTTCEALWMGVPVVTLAGRAHASRVGASLLGAAGCGSWVAGTRERYAEIAGELVRDPARLAADRAELRARVAASALCDAGAWVGRFEGAVREAWRAWCVSAS